MNPLTTPRAQGLALVLVATVLWSTAGVFVRAVDLDVWSIAGWRALFAALSLLLIVVIREGRNMPATLWTLGRPGLFAALMSGVSMFCYIAALKLTTVANVLTVYATIPFVAAGLAFLWTGERAKRRVCSPPAASRCSASS